jgi:hypothetical protein
MNYYPFFQNILRIFININTTSILLHSTYLLILSHYYKKTIIYDPDTFVYPIFFISCLQLIQYSIITLIKLSKQYICTIENNLEENENNLEENENNLEKNENNLEKNENSLEENKKLI